MEHSRRRRRPRAKDQTPTSSPSSSSSSSSRAHASNANKQRSPAPVPAGASVRQSALYSDRRSRRRPTRPSSQDKLQVEERSGEVGSREFQALTLGQSPATLDSTHSLPGTATRVRQSVLYSKRISQSSHARQEQESSPPHRTSHWLRRMLAG